MLDLFRVGAPGAGAIAIAEMGGNAAVGAAGVVPRWYNPLDSVAIDARIAAGGLWAWRAQANDNVTWGPGPANYAASLVDLAQGQVLVEGNGPVPWLAATGWDFVAAAVQYFDTGVAPDCSASAFTALIQYTNYTVATTSFYGVQDTIVPLRGASYINGTAPNTMVCRNGITTALSANLPWLANGNYGFAGKQPYRNGVAEANPIGPGNQDALTRTAYIGALNSNGAPIWHPTVEIQAVLLCDDFTAFAPADIAAIAALPAGSMHNL